MATSETTKTLEKNIEKYKVNNSKVEQLLNDKTYLYGGAFYLGINIYNKMFSN